MLFQIISLLPFTYLFVAVPALESRQELDLCSPQPPSGSKLISGGKVNIQINDQPQLYWNASFPKRDFSEGFTEVLLAVRFTIRTTCLPFD
jgi:hypothetical protein